MNDIAEPTKSLLDTIVTHDAIKLSDDGKLTVSNNDPKPTPLTPTEGPKNDYPLDALGEILGAAAADIADIVQCPKGIAGQSILAAASFAAQSRANVVIDSRRSPLSLFCITVAESGDRKTQADKIAIEPFFKRQREQTNQYNDDLKGYKNSVDSYEKERARILKNESIDKIQTEQALDDLQEPNIPIDPSVLVQEPTLEGLHKAYLKGIPSQALFNDEAGQVFGGHAMNQQNMLKTISGLSKLWDGTPIIRTRSGEGENSSLYDRRLSVHLMMQPVVAIKALNDPVLQGQGFIPRFLISFPESIAGNRSYNNKNHQESDAINRYHEHLSAHLSEPLPMNGNRELVLPDIELNPEAKQLWVAIYNRIEKEIKVGGEFELIKPMACKAAEMVARIAGVLTVFNSPKSTTIPLESVEGAIRLIDYYLAQAVAFASDQEQNGELSEAKKFINWYLQKGKVQFCANEISREGPNKKRSTAAYRPLVNLLVRHDWLIPIQGGVEYRGKPCKDAWRINNHVRLAHQS